MDRFYPQPVELIELGEGRYFIKAEGNSLMRQLFKYHFQFGLFPDSDHDCACLAFPIWADSTVPHTSLLRIAEGVQFRQ